MSIIIKGMDMPRNNPMTIVIDTEGKAYRKEGAEWAEYQAIQIPHPHGRLKDETELADILDKELDSIAMERESISKSARLSLIRDLALKFHNAPTILTEE